jgi:hypothetical protein
MKLLMLKTTAAHYGGDWSDHDHVVLENGNVVGRIMLHPQGPKVGPGCGASSRACHNAEVASGRWQSLRRPGWRLSSCSVLVIAHDHLGLMVADLTLINAHLAAELWKLFIS